MAAPQRSIFINLTSLLMCRSLRGRFCNFPLKVGRGLCSISSMDRHEEMNSADAAMMLGLKRKECRYRRSLKLRKNRHDTYLEKKARTGHLFIPLSNVQAEWRYYRGLEHLHTIGVHNKIFSDVFNRDFRPKGFIDVTYGDTDIVHHGNLLTPEQTSVAPRVQLPQELKRREGYASLVLSNPDGHLRDNSLEVLHWMIMNIRTSSLDMSSGNELMPYLQPLPLRGTSFHRYVFSLFTHHEPLDLNHSQLGLVSPEGGRGTWLDQRTFSTRSFLSRYPQLEPFTFALFQSQWDSSVQHIFSNVLGYPEPVYGLEKEVTPRQVKRMEVRRKRANMYRNV